MRMLHFRVPTSCNGMRLNIFLRTMGVSSACIKAVKYQGTGFCVRKTYSRIRLHRVINTAASGYKYGCVGLRIWQHWVTNMAASGYEYGCVG